MHLRPRPYLLPFLLLLSLGLTAQRVGNSQPAQDAYEKGVQLMLAGKHKKAWKPLREANKLDPDFLLARRLLGTAYELEGEYAAAALAYTDVLERDSLFSRYLYFQAAETLYKSGEPDRAIDYYRRFADLQAQDYGVFGINGEAELPQEARAVEVLDGRLRAARITNDSTEFINVTEVVNLDFPVNTQMDDYAIFFANDQLSALMTRQGEGDDEDLLRVRRKSRDGELFTSRFGSINTTKPEGMLSLIRDGETVFFTLCHEDDGVGGCDLYTGFLIDDRIRDVERLPDYVNSPTWDSQAAISCDGRQLFFASTRPGGVGGSDIYVCNRRDDGSWSEPQNLGRGVNTPENEETPFISNDGSTLYFASAGHYSLGDQDIFTSWWDNKRNTWTQAINLGPPVNGPHRELGFHLSSDGRTGYFASDRPGGRGRLDLYSFVLAKRLSGEPITYVQGYLLDSLSGEPIVDQVVAIEDGPIFRTNYGGRFFYCAPSDEVLPLTVGHPDYLPYQRDFAIPAWDNASTYRIDLLLQKEYAPPPPPSPPPVVEPEPEPEAIPDTIVADTIERRVRIVKKNLTVRFSFDDASLTLRQIENISKFVEGLAGKTIMEITVSGYTDSIGEGDYNVELSQDRARAVGIHLQSAGVTASKFDIRGLGEIAGSQNKELNRKVEVQVKIRELVPVE